MVYRLEFSKDAQKDLAKLDKEILTDIRRRLERLVMKPTKPDILRLKENFQAYISCVSGNIV